MDNPLTLCPKCEQRPRVVPCDCTQRFCEECFIIHKTANPTHERAGTRESESRWTRIIGPFSGVIDSVKLATNFQKDELAKWFGLYTVQDRDDRRTSLVETYRFTHLAEESLHAYDTSPNRQYPSLCSFIGETGAGKSHLST
jgi:hypothetical protein